MSQKAINKTAVRDTFSNFLPADYVDLIVDLYKSSSVKFKIVSGRKTKLGDFRSGLPGEKHQITVNGDLNPYSFLITTLHEFAHLNTYNRYQRSVLPHGEEWKIEFRRLLLPVIDHTSTPENLKKALIKSLVNTKASSCSDHHLSRALMQFDKPIDGLEILEHLPKNAIFVVNNKQFKKGELRRKRFLCEDLNNGRSYLVNALAKVTLIKNE